MCHRCTFGCVFAEPTSAHGGGEPGEAEADPGSRVEQLLAVQPDEETFVNTLLRKNCSCDRDGTSVKVWVELSRGFVEFLFKTMHASGETDWRASPRRTRSQPEGHDVEKPEIIGSATGCQIAAPA